MNLKTLFWEAVQAYIFFNSLLKGSKAQRRLTGLTSSDARTDDTAMCTECHMLRVVRDQPLLRTLGQGHSLLYNAPHSLNTTISTRLPRSWGYCCFMAHCSLLLGVLFCLGWCLGWHVYVEIISFLAQTSIAGSHLCWGQWWVIPGNVALELRTGRTHRDRNWLSSSAWVNDQGLGCGGGNESKFFRSGDTELIWSLPVKGPSKAGPGFRISIMNLNVRKLSNVSNWVPNQQSQQYERSLQTGMH